MIEGVTKEDILQQLANKHDLPVSKVKQAVDHQFKMVHKTIKAGSLNSIRLPYWGVYKPQKKYLNNDKG